MFPIVRDFEKIQELDFGNFRPGKVLEFALNVDNSFQKLLGKCKNIKKL